MRTITLSLMACTVLIAADPSAASRGSNIGNTALGIFGSKDGVNNRLAQPLMSKTQMTTVDGTKSFDAQIQCPASSKSVGIAFIPAGGNDYRLIIKQDTNLDGTYDYTYDTNSVGRTVSGVCTNGVLMCNPAGSWTDCKPYVWDATSNKQVKLRGVTAQSTELGACYCSNASCGVSSLAPQIYENIGGGISAAIMKSNPLFLQSKSEWSFAEMTYFLYGQDKTNCTGLGSSNWDKYGEKNPTIYYEGQFPPSTSIGDVAIEQGSDPTSYYSMISHQNEVAYNNAGDTITMPSKTSCVVTKTPIAQLTTKSTTLSTTQSICTDHELWLKLVYNKDTSVFTYDMAGAAPGSYLLPNGNPNTMGHNCGGAGWQNFITKNLSTTLGFGGGTVLNTSYRVNMTVTDGGGCNVGATGTANYLGNNRVSIAKWFQNLCPASGAQTPTLAVSIDVSAEKEEFKLTESNGCATQEADSTCRVVDEQICDQGGSNCIYTIRDGAKQTTIPQKRCYSHDSSIVPTTLCADGSNITAANTSGSVVLGSGDKSWFYIKRTYECTAKDININASAMTRAAGTASKTDQSATSMTYTDLDGSVKTISNLPGGDDCPNPVCTVKRPKQSADQFGDGTNRSQTPGGTTVTETIIKTCTKSGSTMTCPVDASLSETKVEDCSCTGSWTGFQQAVTTVGAVSEAAKDLICSQN